MSKVECLLKKPKFLQPLFFDKDMMEYSYFFNEIDRKTKIRKIYFAFKLFFRIIDDYWNHVNKNVVDEYFNLFEPNNHDVCRKVKNFSSFFINWFVLIAHTRKSFISYLVTHLTWRVILFYQLLMKLTFLTERLRLWYFCFFLTLKNFFHQHWLEEFMMGCVQSKKEGVILKNNLPENKKILKVAGENVLKKDSDFNILWWLLYDMCSLVFGLKIIWQLPHPRLMFCILIAALTLNNFFSYRKIIACLYKE